MRIAWRPDLRPEEIWGDTENRVTILVNALSQVPGGSHTVLSNYWPAFTAQRPEWRFINLRGPYREDLDADLGPTVRTLHCGPETRGLAGRYLWERRQLSQLCEHLRCDIYFGPNGVYHPNVKAPQCLLVQDPTPYVLDLRAIKARTRAWLLRRSWRAGVRKAACMGYTSRYMRQLVIQDAGGILERRHIIAYDGIDGSMRATAEKPFRSRSERAPFVLSVSTLSPHKNFETLIRALAILRRTSGFRDYKLRIVGRFIQSGPYLGFLRAEIRTLGLSDAVSVEVDRPWNEVSQAYASAALFSLTSLCESFGIPALEAMAHGTPAVLGECCAIPEVCGSAAILVPPRSAEALAEAWGSVLSDDLRYQELQAAGRRRCLEFDWHKTVAQWIEVMEDLVLSRSRQEAAINR